MLDAAFGCAVTAAYSGDVQDYRFVAFTDGVLYRRDGCSAGGRSGKDRDAGGAERVVGTTAGGGAGRCNGYYGVRRRYSAERCGYRRGASGFGYAGRAYRQGDRRGGFVVCDCYGFLLDAAFGCAVTAAYSGDVQDYRFVAFTDGVLYRRDGCSAGGRSGKDRDAGGAERVVGTTAGGGAGRCNGYYGVRRRYSAERCGYRRGASGFGYAGRAYRQGDRRGISRYNRCCPCLINKAVIIYRIDVIYSNRVAGQYVHVADRSIYTRGVRCRESSSEDTSVDTCFSQKNGLGFAAGLVGYCNVHRLYCSGARVQIRVCYCQGNVLPGKNRADRGTAGGMCGDGVGFIRSCGWCHVASSITKTVTCKINYIIGGKEIKIEKPGIGCRYT